MTIIYRDASHAPINIGPWDYKTEPRPIVAAGGEIIGQSPLIDPLTGLPLLDDQGEPRFVDQLAQAGDVIGYDHDDPIVHNPLPEGAYEDDAEIGQREDGGLYVIEAG